MGAFSVNRKLFYARERIIPGSGRAPLSTLGRVEIAPKMLARVSKKTGLTPDDL